MAKGNADGQIAIDFISLSELVTKSMEFDIKIERKKHTVFSVFSAPPHPNI